MSAYARQALLMNPNRAVSFSSESRQRHHSNPDPSTAAEVGSNIGRNGRISNASRAGRFSGRGSEGIVRASNGGEISCAGASNGNNQNTKNFRLENNNNNHQVFKTFQEGDDKEEIPIEGSIHVPHDNPAATFSQISMSQQSEEVSAGSTNSRNFKGGGFASACGSSNGGGIEKSTWSKRSTAANIPQGRSRYNSYSHGRNFQERLSSSGISLSQPTSMPSYSQRSNFRSRRNQSNVEGGNRPTTAYTMASGGNKDDESTVQSSQPVLTPVLPSALRKRSSDTVDAPNQQLQENQSMRFSQGNVTPSGKLVDRTNNALTNTSSSSKRRDKRARMIGPSTTPLRGKVSTNTIAVPSKQPQLSSRSSISPFSNSSRPQSNATTTHITSSNQNNSIRSNATGTLSVLRTPLRSASALAARVTNSFANPFVEAATTPFRRIKSVQTAAVSSLNGGGGGKNRRAVNVFVGRYPSGNGSLASANGNKDGVLASLERKKHSPSLSPYVGNDTITPKRVENGTASARRSLVINDNTHDDNRTVDADDMHVEGDALSSNIDDRENFVQNQDDESKIECNSPPNSRHLGSIQIDDVRAEQLHPCQRKPSTATNSSSAVLHSQDKQSILDTKKKISSSPSSRDTLREHLFQKLNDLDSNEEKEQKHNQNVDNEDCSEKLAISIDLQDKSKVTTNDEADSVMKNVANQLSKLEEMLSRVQSASKEMEEKRLELEQEKLKIQDQRKNLDEEQTKKQTEFVQMVDRARQEMKDHCTCVADKWRAEFDSFTFKLGSAAVEHRGQIRQLTEDSKKEVEELIDGCKTYIHQLVISSKDDIHRVADSTKNDIDQIIVTSKKDVLKLVNDSTNDLDESSNEAKCKFKQSVDEVKKDLQLSANKYKCELQRTLDESKRHFQQLVDDFRSGFQKILDESNFNFQKSVDASRNDSRHFFYKMKQDLQEDMKHALVSQKEVLLSDVHEMTQREARKSIEDVVANVVTSAKVDLESIARDVCNSTRKDCVEISRINCEGCSSSRFGLCKVETSTVEFENKTSGIPASSTFEDKQMGTFTDLKTARESSPASNSKDQDPKSAATTRTSPVDTDQLHENCSNNQCPLLEQHSYCDKITCDEANESNKEAEEKPLKHDELSKQRLTKVRSSRPLTNKVTTRSTSYKSHISHSSPASKPKSAPSRERKKSSTSRLPTSADKKRKQNYATVARSPRRSKRLKESKRAEHLKALNASKIIDTAAKDNELVTKSRPATPAESIPPSIQRNPAKAPSSTTRILTEESLGDVSNGHDSLLGAVVTVNHTVNDGDGGQDDLQGEKHTSFFASWRRSSRRKKAGRSYTKLNKSSLTETMSSIFEFKF
ncbi:hypothetical protein ACHAXS_011732 [Conticribra weissflogii]